MWDSLDKETIKQEVMVAIIDGGMEISNIAIADYIWVNDKEIPDNGIDDDNNGFVDDVNGWNFVKNSGEVSSYIDDKSELNHGTKIAGIICADSEKSEVAGIVSGSWIKIMPLSVIDGFRIDSKKLGSGNVDNLIKAINYAEMMGADICNISLNTSVDYEELKKTMEESNMLFVVSAGNGSGLSRNIDINPSYPASYDLPNLITVANVKSNGRLNSKSNYGVKSVDVAAPGTDIYNLDVQDGYTYGTGTSYSAPVVAAEAAAIYSVNMDMYANKCKQIICDSADDFQALRKKVSGGSIINCQKALNKETK